MSTLDEVLLTRHRLSEYHVYHDLPGKQHLCITPFCDITKEPGYRKKKRKNKQLQETEQGSHRNDDPQQDSDYSYFVHHPVLTWHHPPRTLRRGNSKTGEPVCLLHNGIWWKEWRIQFSPELARIIDPRGLVRWEHRSRKDNRIPPGDAHALKGYKVRTWRLCGETGKAYHREVNARRKELQENGRDEVKEHPFEPVVADEAIRLTWSSPFSSKTRRYQFTYAGIEFFWEGTRDMPTQEKWARRLMPFHHLKLMAVSPTRGKVFIGQYVCSFSSSKCGRLWIFDSVMESLLLEGSLPSMEKPPVLDPDFNIRNTRLYDLVMATAMCMVIAEWQKRTTIKMIILLALQAVADVDFSS